MSSGGMADNVFNEEEEEDLPPPPPPDELILAEDGQQSPVQALAIRSLDQELSDDQIPPPVPPGGRYIYNPLRFASFFFSSVSLFYKKKTSSMLLLEWFNRRSGQGGMKFYEAGENETIEATAGDVELLSYRSSRRPSDLSPSQQRRHLNGGRPPSQ